MRFRSRCSVPAKRTSAPAVLLAALGLGALAAGCGSELDLDQNANELGADRLGVTDIGFGINRTYKLTPSIQCKVWETKVDVKPGLPPVKVCKTFGDDYSLPSDVRLFDDPSGKNRWLAYGGEVGQPWLYFGCGTSAAQNILYWYGIKKTVAEVAQRVDRILFARNKIATAPEDLARGLQDMLNTWGDGTFVVESKSHVDIRSTVREELRAGNPIILMRKGGTHYQVVTALAGDTYTLIDYPQHKKIGGIEQITADYSEPEVVVGEQNLDTGISPANLGYYAFGYHGYNPHTVITIRRQPWRDGLYKGTSDASIYSLKARKACYVNWPQFVALGQPGQNLLAPADLTRFRTVYNPQATACTNAALGLWTDGIYKATNDATVYKLKGQRACALTWAQFVALRQPLPLSLSATDAPRFKSGFYSNTLCTNAEAGI